MPTIPATELVPGVEETEDFLVFFAESSEPGKEPYRVDKQKFCGNGDCDCPDFRVALRAGEGRMTRRQALLKGAYPSEDLKCKHIKRVDRYLLQKVVNGAIEKRESEANANKQKAKEASRVGNCISKPAQSINQPVGKSSPRTVIWNGGSTPFAKKKQGDGVGRLTNQTQKVSEKIGSAGESELGQDDDLPF